MRKHLCKPIEDGSNLDPLLNPTANQPAEIFPEPLRTEVLDDMSRQIAKESVAIPASIRRVAQDQAISALSEHVTKFKTDIGIRPRLTLLVAFDIVKNSNSKM